MHEAILDNGWFITFYPTSFPDVSWDQAYRLYPGEVEVAAGSGRAGLQSFLTSRAGYYDAILVSRPHNMELVNGLLAAEPELLGRTRVIYDAEAIVAPREALKRKLAGMPLTAKEQQKALQQELSLARYADCVVAVSESDAEIFRSAVTCEVVVVGHAVEPAPTPEPFEERKDVLFVGAIDVDDSPNVDSLVWFVESVMPLLDKLIGSSWRLRVAGTNKSQLARSLAGPRVELLGLVDDLRPLYGGSRLFIAPTRFAAGIPMKAHEAAAAGLPMVSSRLIARQLTWSNGRELMAADDPEEFALSCAKLYEDRQVWKKMRAEALRRVEMECSSHVFSERLAEALKACLQVR
jgi:glycosyltransferase involved in cell wall biosynthesis